MHDPVQKPLSGIAPAPHRVIEAVDRTMNLPGDFMLHENPRLADDDDKEKDGADGGMMKKLLKTRSILVFEQVSDKLARRVQSIAKDPRSSLDVAASDRHQAEEASCPDIPEPHRMALGVVDQHRAVLLRGV